MINHEQILQKAEQRKLFTPEQTGFLSAALNKANRNILTAGKSIIDVCLKHNLINIYEKNHYELELESIKKSIELEVETEEEIKNQKKEIQPFEKKYEVPVFEMSNSRKRTQADFKYKERRKKVDLCKMPEGEIKNSCIKFREMTNKLENGREERLLNIFKLKRSK